MGLLSAPVMMYQSSTDIIRLYPLHHGLALQGTSSWKQLANHWLQFLIHGSSDEYIMEHDDANEEAISFLVVVDNSELDGYILCCLSYPAV